MTHVDVYDTSWPPVTADEATAIIESQFDHLEGLADRFDALAEDVSGWSVGRHAFHLALSGSNLAVSLISGRLWDGVPSAPDLKPRILESGTIPLGQTEAPEPVRPGGDPTAEEIRAALDRCRARVERIIEAPENAFLIHPYLGRLSRDELIRFIAIHNRHHLGIIDLILQAE